MLREVWFVGFGRYSEKKVGEKYMLSWKKFQIRLRLNSLREWDIFSKNIHSSDWRNGFSSNPLYHPFILLKRRLWFWTIAKSHFGDEQLSCFFFFFFIKSIPRGGKRLTRMKSSHRLHLDVKNVLRASWGFRGWNNNNRYDRPKKLQTNSHLWVNMHMQFGFWVILHLTLFFSRVTSSNRSSLLCRNF